MSRPASEPRYGARAFRSVPLKRPPPVSGCRQCAGGGDSRCGEDLTSSGGDHRVAVRPADPETWLLAERERGGSMRGMRTTAFTLASVAMLALLGCATGRSS